MDVGVSSLLFFHRDGSCISAGDKKFERLNQLRRNWTSAVVRMLAIVTILGPSASTLLDLVFRVRVAEHYTSQAQRIHFMGSLQVVLCLGALLPQFAVRRLTSGPWTTPPQERGPWGVRALGFTDLQISKEEVVVRDMGKDATVLYEFKKPVDIIDCSSSRSRTSTFSQRPGRIHRTNYHAPTPAGESRSRA
jgi:hypothetical protein